MARHIPRVYCSHALQAHAAVELTGPTAHHLLRVLRIKVGMPVVLFDGHGGEYPAVVKDCDKQRLSLLTSEMSDVDRESPLRISLLQGVARGEHMDYCISKAVELGAAQIRPLMLERSQGMDTKRLTRKLSHWQGIVHSAAEQCGRTAMPNLCEVEDLTTGLAAVADYDLKLVLHPGPTTELSQASTPCSIAVLIGPEGGLTDAEVEAAAAAGFIVMGMGPRILRTETAAMTALSILQARWGDLSD